MQKAVIRLYRAEPLPMAQPHDWPYPFRRLFARILSAHVECPRCAGLISFGNGLARTRANARDRNQPGSRSRFPFNRTIAILSCPRCGKRCQLGVIMWSIDRTRTRRPIDQIPNTRQLAELRQYAHGFYIPESKSSAQPTNRYVDAECTCSPLPWRAECPVHGSGGDVVIELNTPKKTG